MQESGVRQSATPPQAPSVSWKAFTEGSEADAELRNSEQDRLGIGALVLHTNIRIPNPSDSTVSTLVHSYLTYLSIGEDARGKLRMTEPWEAGRGMEGMRKDKPESPKQFDY